MATIVKCPTCGNSLVWGPESPFRPFCSERCRLIDLGKWASGENSISTPITEKDLEDPNVAEAIEKALNAQLGNRNIEEDNEEE